jgi:hypothetical protein
MLRRETPFAILMLLATAACSDGTDVADEEAAEIAYLGVDESVELALKLGFDGFNAASSANIPEQSASGADTGTLRVGGKVDQGASNNKEMDLEVSYENYSDGPVRELIITYDSESPVILDLSLKKLPNADMTGSMIGTLYLSGDLEGPVDLNLSITGTTEPDPDNADEVRRTPGDTRVSGTATSDYGVFDVDVTI